MLWVLHEVRVLLADNATSSWMEPCSVNSRSLGGTQKLKSGLGEIRNMWAPCGKWVITLKKNQNVSVLCFIIEKGARPQLF